MTGLRVPPSPLSHDSTRILFDRNNDLHNFTVRNLLCHTINLWTVNLLLYFVCQQHWTQMWDISFYLVDLICSQFQTCPFVPIKNKLKLLSRIFSYAECRIGYFIVEGFGVPDKTLHTWTSRYAGCELSILL